MEQSSRLQGRVAVITGGTRGIGLIIAQSLAAAGANVVICSRSSTTVEAACQRLASLPKAQVLGVTCDITELDQVEALAQKALDRFEKIDVWFNNAAITHPFGPALDIPISRWREVIDTNICGTYYGTRVALQHMLPRNQGKIINSLGAGSTDNRNNSYLSAYTTSKAAVRRFTLVVADDYRDTGLSILGLNPGLVPTDMTTKIEPLNEEAARRLKILDFGLNWLATPPEKISQMAVHVASDATDGKTGKLYRCLPSLPFIAQRLMQRS
ncbi:MAG: SDR family oxidoreductase [Cyanothece sp. SIO1E1]|nr:SDR family oxidoreductase [Cyanothece sp. SIO1E1]